MPLTVYDLAVPAREVRAAEVMVGERVILTGQSPRALFRVVARETHSAPGKPRTIDRVRLTDSAGISWVHGADDWLTVLDV